MGGTVSITSHLSHERNVQPHTGCVTTQVSLNILIRRFVVSIFPFTLYVYLTHISLPLRYNLKKCRQTSNTRRILVGDKIVDHSNAVGALPVGAAPTISLFPI